MSGKQGANLTWRVRTSWPTGQEGLFAPWRPPLGLPKQWHATLESDDVPYTVELEMAFDADAPTCRALCLVPREGGPSITGARMRDVPVGECIEIAITAATGRLEVLPDGRFAWDHDVGADTEHWQQARRAARSPKAHTSDAHLQAVARVYRSNPGKPTQAVSNAWPSVGYSTAARWVMEARRRGFLPPANRSKPKPKEGK